MKKTFIYITIFIVILAVVIILINERNKKLLTPITAKESQTTEMCYEYLEQTSRTFADQAWIKMTILDNNITGEYQNLPAEKDSRTGKINGAIVEIDSKINKRTALVNWDSFIEGMNEAKQLKIEFDENDAVALDGLTQGLKMSRIDCVLQEDKNIIEKYVRDNIKNIITEKPVLGGSWYAVIIKVNPYSKTGTVTYEDGHIQGEANFSYFRNGEEVKVNIMNQLPSSNSN